MTSKESLYAETDQIQSDKTDSRKYEVSLVNTSVLAYIGDAVYETYVRRHVFHQDELTPDEQAVGRRGKNHKITSMPHNVDPRTYKTATAFEALVGYLNLSGDREREKYIIDRTFDIIENSEITLKRSMKGNRGQK